MNNLHQQFVKLGQEHRVLVNKIAAILPQIYKEKIYEKYAKDIYEYGRKYAGLSGGVVSKILWTYKKIENKPTLKESVEMAGIHKVSLVATIATSENEKELAEKVVNMSKAAVVEFVKELRGNRERKMTIELDSEMQFLFKKLKANSKEEISDQEFLRKILVKLDELNYASKVKKVESIPGDGKKSSRYVPVEIKRIVVERTRGKCAFRGCSRGYEELHHTVPYSYVREHNPEHMEALCKVHHELVHNGIKPYTTSQKLSNADKLRRRFVAVSRAGP